MKKRDTLTRNQQRVYEFIRDYLTEHGQSPTLTEIAEAIKARSLRSVTQYLESLERKNLIRRERYAKRGIRLVEDESPFEEVVQVPVFASAGAGSPSIIAERTFDEFIPVSRELVDGKENVFVIKAIGSSMVDAGINDGDFILTERTQNVETGDLVVAIIDDTAVIKKINFANNAIILNPVTSDKSHRPIIMRRDFKVFGKVIDVIRVEKIDDYEIVPLNEPYA